MTFDPFDDFETRGYLRNLFGEKDLEIVRHLEHSSFMEGVDEAFERLSRIEHLSYRDVLDTHKALFGDMYPWAGQDRAQTAPGLAITKGSVLFAHPDDAKLAAAHALNIGQDKTAMANKPGEVMGYLAYAHPFLDGNGRTIMVVHAELAQRAGISIEWAATTKTDYLNALTRELDNPAKGHLDAYLKPFVRDAVGHDRLASHIALAQGLDGKSDPTRSGNEVLGQFSEPDVQARYQRQEQRRRQGQDTASPYEERLADRQAAYRAEAKEAEATPERSNHDPAPSRGGRGD